MRSTTVVLAAAAAIAALSLTACSADIVDAAETEEAPAATEEAPAEAPAEGVIAPATLPAGAVWLYDLEHDSDTGNQVAIDYNGGAAPNSTGFHVSCDGELTGTVYELDGAYELLTGHLVLRDGAPEDLAVRVYLVLDGVDLSSTMIFKSEASFAATVEDDPSNTGAFDALVEGGDELVVYTQLEEGTCTIGEDPYVSLAETYVAPAS